MTPTDKDRRGSGLSMPAPTPLLEETKRHRDLAPKAALWMDEATTFMLPAVGIDQLPTQVGLRAIPKPSPIAFPASDGLSLADQPTWILPVIPGTARRKGFRSARLGKTSRESGVGSLAWEAGNEEYGPSRERRNTDPQVLAGQGQAAAPAALLRNLVKSSGIYALSSLVSPLVSLLLAPFLTHTLSRSDYGTLAILNTIVTLVAGVAELGLSAAFTRMYSYDCETPSEQLAALSTLVMLLICIVTPLSLVGIMCAPWLAAQLLNSASPAAVNAVRVAAVLALLQDLAVPGLAWLRTENHPALFSILSVGNLLVTAGANIVLVGALGMGVSGSLIATGVGSALVIACTLPVILVRAGLRLHLEMARAMVAFGAPHALNVISGWVLQLSDRYLLGHFASLTQVAGYSVAYSLGGILSAMIISPFSLAWWVLMYPIAKRDDAPRMFRLIFRWFSIVLLFATFGLSLGGISVLDLFFPVPYHADAPIIPLVALATMFNGVFLVVSLGVSLRGKTWLASLYFIASALINVGLNLLLIPHYGALGAAISTLVAYIALALMAYIANWWIYPVAFEVGLFLGALAVGVALYAAGDALITSLPERLQGQSFIVTLSIHAVALLLYGGALAALGLLPMRGEAPLASRAQRGLN
ncbi:MAG: lipopolysaccharide biosynthesis protein [Ktedonobacteraceae bacterium]